MAFDDFMRDFDLPGLSRYGLANGWPRVELSETDKDVKVMVELPGMDESDVDLLLADNMLILTGEKRAETEEALYTERWHGRFKRAVALGCEIDPDKVTVVLDKGVLTVTIGKRQVGLPTGKNIAVRKTSRPFS
ncbi:MAG: Hsp20/alpha crystallin family protein [Dongiaceae bacterium]